MFGETRLVDVVLALAIAAGIGALILIASGHDPAQALAVLVSGAFGSRPRIGETLLNSVPLMFTGFAVALSFRGGLFNIGGEGQLLVGAIVTAWLAEMLPFGPVLLIPILIVAGGAAGAAWGAVPGIMKATADANEIITTLMMSYIAFFLVEYLVVGPLKAPGVLPATPLLSEGVRLPRIGDVVPGLDFGRLHMGLIVGVAVGAILTYVIRRTPFGFGLQALGRSQSAALYAGVSKPRMVAAVLTVSGALAGIGGAVQVLGVNFRVSSSFSPGFGFTGIAVALLGNSSPIGVIFAAVLFGALQTGGQVMQRTADTPASIVVIVQGLIVALIAVRVRRNGKPSVWDLTASSVKRQADRVRDRMQASAR